MSCRHSSRSRSSQRTDVRLADTSDRIAIGQNPGFVVVSASVHELGLSFILRGEIGQNVVVLNQIKRFAEVANKLEASVFVANRKSN